MTVLIVYNFQFFANSWKYALKSFGHLIILTKMPGCPHGHLKIKVFRARMPEFLTF